MTDVKCVSRHVEDLADGRVIAPGETVFDVDLDEETGHNKDLAERGAIIALDANQAKANDEARKLANQKPPGKFEPEPGDGASNDNGEDGAK